MVEELNRLKIQLRESHLYIEKMMTNPRKKAKPSSGKQIKPESGLVNTVDSESHILIDHAKSAQITQNYISIVQSNFIGKLLWYTLFETQNKELKKEEALIQESGFFDTSWYLAGKCPSASFDTSWYLNTNSDIKDAAVNPLVHYILFGKSEGRSPRKK